MSNAIGPSGSRQLRPSGIDRYWLVLKPFVVATLVIAIASLVAPVLQRLPHANLSLLFMTGVLIVAARYGLWASIYASVLSFLIFNFFFTAPVYTFSVSEEGDLATLIFFLLMASISGNLAARMRDAITNREQAIMRTASLQELTREVAGAATRRHVMEVLAQRMAGLYGVESRFLVDDAQSGVKMAVSSKGGDREPSDEYYEELLADTGTDKWTVWDFDDVRSLKGTIAIRKTGLSRDEIDYGSTLASQAAVALERVTLVEQLEAAKLISERERLRAALLSSVSHDLRTPLSSIIGAASSLVAYEHSLKADDKRSLLQSVLDESERLDRYIQNLLDMTRLEQGTLQLQWDWEDIVDLVSAASRRLRLLSRGFMIDVDVPHNAQFVYAHGELLEQVLVNLLENAARYSPNGSSIGIRARHEQGELVIEVSDEGPGIPESDREKVFDPFYRVSKQDTKSGTGLGLSICRGIIRAHGGEVEADSAADGKGALFRLRLPQRQSYPAVA